MGFICEFAHIHTLINHSICSLWMLSGSACKIVSGNLCIRVWAFVCGIIVHNRHREENLQRMSRHVCHLFEYYTLSLPHTN